MGIIFVVKLAASLVFRARSAESHWQCQVTVLVPHIVLAVLRPPWPVPGQKDWEVSVPSCWFPSPWAGQDQGLM